MTGRAIVTHEMFAGGFNVALETDEGRGTIRDIRPPGYGLLALSVFVESLDFPGSVWGASYDDARDQARRLSAAMADPDYSWYFPGRVSIDFRAGPYGTNLFFDFYYKDEVRQGSGVERDIALRFPMPFEPHGGVTYNGRIASDDEGAFGCTLTFGCLFTGYHQTRIPEPASLALLGAGLLGLGLARRRRG